MVLGEGRGGGMKATKEAVKGPDLERGLGDVLRREVRLPSG